jgi:Na+/H+ antiporter NhaA
MWTYGTLRLNTKNCCEISDSHICQHHDESFLGYVATLSRRSRPTFQKCILPQTSEQWPDDVGAILFSCVVLLLRFNLNVLYKSNLTCALVAIATQWDSGQAVTQCTCVQSTVCLGWLWLLSLRSGIEATVCGNFFLSTMDNIDNERRR